MNKIKIQGKEYPVRLTIGAMVAYKRDTGEDFTQFRGDDMEKLGCIIFHAMRTACKSDGVAFPFDKPDDMIDYVDMDQATAALGLAAGQEGVQDAKKTDGYRIDWLCGGCRGNPSGGHLSHGHGNPRRRHPRLERSGRATLPHLVGTDPLPGALPPDALLEEEAPGGRHHPFPVGGRTEEGKRKAPPVVAGRASQSGGEIRRLTPATLLFIFFLFRILAPAIVVS